MTIKKYTRKTLDTVNFQDGTMNERLKNCSAGTKNLSYALALQS